MGLKLEKGKGNHGKPWETVGNRGKPLPGHAVLRSGSSRGSVVVFETAQLFIAEWPLGAQILCNSGDAQLLNAMI